ncbi:hypothetical protein J6590_065335 [Homalodisca vitripennis]|nr:hypothetical protein J6590_065335 [Homalodisca vitripennis]
MTCCGPCAPAPAGRSLQCLHTSRRNPLGIAVCMSTRWLSCAAACYGSHASTIGTCDDGNFEGVITQICSQLRAAQANYPDIDFTSLESVISELLVKIDTPLSSLKTLETRFDHLQAENDNLSTMVQKERCQRRLQLNDSLNAQ